MNEIEYSREDLTQNRLYAAAGYVVFFVPLIWRPKSRLGRSCANQGLLLTIVYVIVATFFSILGEIPLLGWLFHVIGGLAGLSLFVIGLGCGALLLTNGKVTELPYIGFLRIIPDVES